MESSYIIIGRIVRPQGNKGELRVRSEADSPQAFLSFLKNKIFLLGEGEAEPYEIEVENSWLHKGFVILKIRGTDDMNAAENLRGLSIAIKRQDRPSLKENEFYWDQLIGLEVRNKEDEQVIGNVRDVMDLAGNITLEIENKEGKIFLLPFVGAFIHAVDTEKGMLWTSIPKGLDEL